MFHPNTWLLKLRKQVDILHSNSLRGSMRSDPLQLLEPFLSREVGNLGRFSVEQMSQHSKHFLMSLMFEVLSAELTCITKSKQLQESKSYTQLVELLPQSFWARSQYENGVFPFKYPCIDFQYKSQSHSEKIFIFVAKNNTKLQTKCHWLLIVASVQS